MSETLFYTISDYSETIDDQGNYLVSQDNDRVYAKAVKESKGKNILEKSPRYYKYYIKLSPDKNLYDPFPKYTSGSKPSFINKVCKAENNFIEVNQSTFNKYVAFLRTKNSKWLNDAQRDYKD